MFDWKGTLARTLNDTEQEITTLMKSKRGTEYAFDAKDMPLQVVLSCLQIRENRIGIDSVRDEVESELHKVCQLHAMILKVGYGNLALHYTGS